MTRTVSNAGLLVSAMTLAACGGGAGEETTEPCVDTTPPELTSSRSVFLDPGVGHHDHLLVFSEPVEGVDSTTVELRRTRGTGEAGEIIVSPGDDASSWNVSLDTSGWEPRDRYRLVVGGSIHDDCENPLGEDAIVAVSPYPEAGVDLDETSLRDLASSYVLPDAFYEALDEMGLAVEDLSYPDAGATFGTIPTRLHWTDTLRHQGDTAPTFAYMVGEDVQGALAEEPDQVVREMLSAQHTYNVKGGYTRVRFDRRYVITEVETPLLDALRAFYEHPAVEGHPDPPARPWSELEPEMIEQASDFSFESRAALALAIRALLDAADERDQALLGYGVMDMSLWSTLHDYFYRGASGYSVYEHEFGTDAHAAFDFESMNRAGQLASRAVESLRATLVEEETVPGARLEITGPLGRIAVSMEDVADTWTGDDWFLLVDGGGDDTYVGGVATNGGIHLPVSVVLDVSGDDVYRGTEDWDISSGSVPMSESCMQGAGIFGVSVLVDAAGADDYHGAWIAQGSGVFGVGVLVDHAGDDRYRGYMNSQGSGDFGYGLLVDLGSGTDAYETLQRSQGYGGPRGMGWLVDDGGNDGYEAVSEPIVWDWAGEGTNWSGSQGFGYGVRDGFFTAGAPIFSGGLGGLFDLGGDDTYSCAVMCQGFGYAFGTGLLFDTVGDDDHLVTHKYAMGAATHWAVGVLVDGQGRDTYRNSGDDECIGLGYDASTAFHIDRGAEGDVYTMDHAGDFVLGVGRIPALGVLVNEGGDDEYHVPGAGERALGRSYTETGNRDGYLALVPNVGIFLDLGGASDLYDVERPGVEEGTSWIQVDPLGGDWDPATDFGYGLDAE